MKSVSALEVGDWVLYRWKNTERTGQLLQTGDPLVIVPPGGDEALAEEIDPDRVTAEWIPEQPYPHAGRGERGEVIGEVS